MLARAVLLLPVVVVELRLLGFKRCCERTAAAASTGSPHDAAARVDPRTVARLLDVAAHYAPYRSTCLSRSLALTRLLASQGDNAALRIGVRSHGNSIEGHAWVELEGQPLNDTDDVAQRYAAFEGGDANALRWV